MADILRSYHELIRIPTFEERLSYLKCHGSVGEDTFGSFRSYNQYFYTTREWRNLRNHLITRDLGCDLAVSDRQIFNNVIIHHINPITVDDLIEHRVCLVDPDNLVCTSRDTHMAIHYARDVRAVPDFIVRTPNDTCPWRGR